MKLSREWTGEQAKALRVKRNQNQSAFWSSVLVTQSGGSRLEHGRKIHPTVQALLTIAYGTPAQSAEQVLIMRGKNK